MAKEEIVTRSSEFAESVINTVREPLIVLDQDLRVVTVSRSFCEFFQVTPEETLGQLIYDLGNKQWDIPRLRELLEDILPEKTSFDNYEVEHDFATIGRRTMLLNGRQIERAWGKERIILLAIEDITERKEREELQRASSLYARSLLEASLDPFVTISVQNKITDVNEAFVQATGVAREQLIGSDFSDYFTEPDKARAIYQKVLAEGSVRHYPLAIRHTTGRIMDVRYNASLYKDDGKVLGVFATARDVTERNRLEDLLKESEFRYRRIFETASDGIVLLEKGEGHIVQGNEAVEKMLGYSAAEYIGKRLQDIGVPLDMSDFPSIVQDLEKKGILNYEDVPVKTQSGPDVATDIYLVNRATLAQCNIRDVGARKLEEQKLKESEAFTRNILQTIDEGFVVIDPEYRVITANRAYLESVGKSLAEVRGKHCYEVSHHRDKPCNEDGTSVCPVARTFQTGKRSSSLHTHSDLTGAPVNVEMKSYPLKDESGKVVSVIEIINDITERKKLEAQLLQSQKMEAVGTLTGGIAHDFNNILNVIMGYGAMVMDTLAAGSQSQDDMREVLSAADKAADLTKKLLVFSRKQAVDVKPVNVNELILDLQKMLVRIISENIECNLDLVDRPLIVLADGGQIEQVLINIAANARDAMPEGGRLTIGAGPVELDEEYVAAYGYGKPGRYALITVTDTGQGMDAETQKKIFEPFFTTKAVGEGTGLGLAISYGIIKQHGGYIQVYSEPGHGAVFKIYLPLSDEALLPETKTEGVVPVKGGQETVLIAEDDAALRNLSRIVLESFGYTVIAAEDGEEAIAGFMENRERIGLVLLDVIMPRKNGKEVSEAIRKVCPGMKILFMSGYSMDIVRNKELMEAGVDFIQKPFQSKDLLAKVREVLDR